MRNDHASAPEQTSDLIHVPRNGRFASDGSTEEGRDGLLLMRNAVTVATTAARHQLVKQEATHQAH